MRIAVDLDGVCYHWERTARYMLRRWYNERGVLHPAMLERESTHWDDIEQHVSPEAWSWLWHDAVDHGLYRHGHIVSGTMEALEALHLDHDVVIATARPARAVGDTLAWLALHFHRVPIADIRFHHDKLETKADLYIDDSEANVLAIAGAGKRALLFNRPWNQRLRDIDQPLVTRVFGWPHAVEEIQRCQ